MDLLKKLVFILLSAVSQLIMKSFLSWLWGSILGSGTAAGVNIFITSFLFHVNVYPDSSRMFLEPGIGLINLIRILSGCLHGGFIGIIQGLLLLNKIPRSNQALDVSYIGSLLAQVLYGILFGVAVSVDIIFSLGTSESFSGLIWYLLLLSGAISVLAQGLTQHRMVRKGNSELFRWCLFSTISGSLGVVLIISTWLFVIAGYRF